MTGEFSKKSKTNTEKTYEKFEKSSDVFWKNSNVFQEISYVFSETSEILSQSEKSDFGRRGVKVVKAKSAKSQGRRARHTRVRKKSHEGVKNWNESDLSFHPRKFGRTIRKSWCKIYDICKANKAISPTYKEKTALFRRFLSLCLIWHPYSIEGDEIEKQQKKCS